MNFDFEERPPESSFVDVIWRTQHKGDETFVSAATSHMEMVVTKQEGQVRFTVIGPQTKVQRANIPKDAEFIGITFKPGIFMPALPIKDLVDNGIELAQPDNHAFWLQGATWEIPNFENVDTFVARLIHQGYLVREPLVESTLNGEVSDLSVRSVQRRFLRTTGLTHGTLYQIERARKAMALLQQGVSILDTVDLVGYYDQSHMTNSLKQYTGQTPAQLAGIRKTE